jgi:hypothetical protein
MEQIFVMIQKGTPCPFFVREMDERASSRLRDGSQAVHLSAVTSFPDSAGIISSRNSWSLGSRFQRNKSGVPIAPANRRQAGMTGGRAFS